MTAIYIAGAAALVIATWAVLTYNRLVGMRNRVDESWSGIDVQLKRRCDLVPNLVEAVKGYAEHERSVLEQTTQARAGAVAASGPAQSEGAETQLSSALRRVFAVAEGYPDLQASSNFRQLQAALAEVETEVAAARQIYNSNVNVFNTSVQSFPNSLVANIGSFKQRAFFEPALVAERAAPAASFT